MKNNLSYRSLTKKHSFWESLDVFLINCLIVIPICFIILGIPFVLGNISFVQKFMCYASPYGAYLVKTFWGRYAIGWIALILLVPTLFLSYFLAFGPIAAIHIFIAKLILSVRYTRLPLTEQEFNEAFKDKDIVETMDILSKYMTFKRLCICPWKFEYIKICNKHYNEILEKLHSLIYKKFKNMSAKEWKEAYYNATGCSFPYFLVSIDNEDAFWKCFRYTFIWHIWCDEEKFDAFLKRESIIRVGKNAKN